MRRSTRNLMFAGTLMLAGTGLAGACRPAPASGDSSRAQRIDPGSQEAHEVELVGPGRISLPDRNETFPEVDPRDGSLWFSVYDDDFDAQTLMVAPPGPDGWRDATVAPFSGEWGDRAARFDEDGSTLFFTSNRPRPGAADGNFDLWRVTRDGTGRWGTPEPVEGPVNSDAPDIHGRPTPDAFWIASRRPGSLGRSDIYRISRDGTEVTHFGPPLNDELSQPDLWVSPDERCMILVVTERADGLGGDDLYVSRRSGESWGTPRNPGAPINSPEYEYGPSVTPDGRWILFTSHRGGSGDIYRVPASAIECPGPPDGGR